MGTRADFYIKNESSLEWLGSIAWNGQEIDNVAKAQTSIEYKFLVNSFLHNRNDATFPADGWPWSWNNSKLTDCCYVFIPGKWPNLGKVWKNIDRIGSHEDHTSPLLFVPIDHKDEYNDKYDRIVPTSVLRMCVPDMSNVRNVTFGPRSGVIVISV